MLNINNMRKKIKKNEKMLQKSGDILGVSGTYI
jgi:hypothetical protein